MVDFSLGWFVIGTFLISFSQKRFSHLFVPGFVLVLWMVVDKLPRAKGWIAAALIAILLVEPAVYFRELYFTALSKSTKETLPLVQQLRRVSDRGERKGVSAPPNMGNLIIYLAELPVAANTFFYREYLSFDFEMREIGDTQRLLDFLEEHSIGYIIAADDARYRTMLYRLFREEEKLTRFEKKQYQPCAPIYLQFAYDRLACNDRVARGLTRIARKQIGGDSSSLWRQMSLYQLTDASAQ